MKLLHSTYDIERVKRILQKGIKKNDGAYVHEIKNPERIPFTVMPEVLSFAKGSYLFVLNPTWFETHKNQFRANYVNSDEEFTKWVKQMQLEDFENPNYPRGHNEIISLGSVPLSALEKLAVPKTSLSVIEERKIIIPDGISVETY